MAARSFNPQCIHASYLKAHGGLNTESIAARAVAAESRGMVASYRSSLDEARLQERLRACERKCTINAQHMFCKHKMSASRAGRENNMYAVEENQAIIASHAAEFAALPQHEKDRYEDLAFEERHRRERMNEQDILELRAKLRIIETRQRVAHDSELGVPNSVGAVRLGEGDLETLASIVNGHSCRGVGMERQWGLLTSAPAAPPVQHQQRLLALSREYSDEVPEAPVPWWLAHVAENREQFRHVGLVFEEDTEAVLGPAPMVATPDLLAQKRRNSPSRRPRVKGAFGSRGFPRIRKSTQATHPHSVTVIAASHTCFHISLGITTIHCEYPSWQFFIGCNM